MNSFKNLFSFSELNLSGDFVYQINEQHRDNNPNKSQWIISRQEEVEIFANSYQNCWFEKDNCISFGLKLNDNELVVLGLTKNYTKSKIAKFCLNSKLWHGYPADLTLKKDIPSNRILLDWLRLSYISKKQCVNINLGRGLK